MWNFLTKKALYHDRDFSKKSLSIKRQGGYFFFVCYVKKPRNSIKVLTIKLFISFKQPDGEPRNKEFFNAVKASENKGSSISTYSAAHERKALQEKISVNSLIQWNLYKTDTLYLHRTPP